MMLASDNAGVSWSCPLLDLSDNFGVSVSHTLEAGVMNEDDRFFVPQFPTTGWKVSHILGVKLIIER